MARTSNAINIVMVQVKACMLALACVCAFSTLLVTTVSAQEEVFADVQPTVTLYHTPPYRGDTLLPAGRVFPVAVDLFHTESTEYPMKLLAVRDGVLTEIPPSRIFVNTHDRPEYVFDLVAPRGEISYQFVYYPPVGSPIFSDHYLIRRNCVTDVKLTDLDNDIASQGSERLEELVGRARALENEINLYTELSNIVKKIKSELDTLER